MKFSKYFLLTKLKRKMSYKLQNVMSFKFNIIKNIYKLIRLTQLKKDHYKHINDVKTRRRFDAIIDEVIIAKTRTKAIIIKTSSASLSTRSTRNLKSHSIAIFTRARQSQQIHAYQTSIRLKKS